MYVISNYTIRALRITNAPQRLTDITVSKRMCYKICWQFDKFGLPPTVTLQQCVPRVAMRHPSITNFDRKYTSGRCCFDAHEWLNCGCINLIVARITNASLSRLFTRHRYFRRRMRVVQHYGNI